MVQDTPTLSSGGERAVTDSEAESGDFHCGECGREMNWTPTADDSRQPPGEQLECPKHGLTEPEEGWP